MRPHIQLVMKPDIDIELFLRVVREAIGFSPNKGLDRGTKKFGDYERFLAMLSAFHNPDITERPTDAIRRAGSLCAHLHFGFFVVASPKTISKSMERTSLDHTITEQLDEQTLALVSGTFDRWKAAMLECTTEDQDFNLRFLYDLVFLEFRRLRMHELLRDTVTHKEPDQTFRIEHK